MASVPSAALILWLLYVSSSTFSSISDASELSLVVSGPTSLQVSPSLLVENSPGTKPGFKVKCERVEIHGLPRIKHLDKFANSVKVKVSYVNPSGRPPNVDICFHRNASLGIGMCPQGQWERLTKGLWVKSMSPFDHKILDMRTAASYSQSLEVSLNEEIFWYRVWFLVSGLLLLTLASWISKSLVFYYSGAMAIGVFLVMLIILFQGMKLLPSGRKSSLAIFFYSCFVGLGSFLLSYLPRLLHSLLVEIGLSEDMYNPVATFLLIFLVITGAWLGFWTVRKLVLTEDGSIDTDVSHFVTWSIRVVASLLILQSSVDPLLAAEALMVGIIVSSVLKRSPSLARRVYRKSYRSMKIKGKESSHSYPSRVNNSSIPRPSTRAPRTPVQASRSPTRLLDSHTFYSTFHNTPERRKFSKDEWEMFTRDSTRTALEDLVSSPDFGNWAVQHADRLTLAPKKEIADKRRSWFPWF